MLVQLISEDLIMKIEPFVESKREKLKINSMIIIGFFVLENPNFINTYFPIFIHRLTDKSEDVRDNAHYFLQEYVKNSPTLMSSCANIILNALILENKNENIISLLNFLPMLIY